MSRITPPQTLQPNPDAGAGASPSLSDATWEIWVRERSTLPNQQEVNQPGNFIRRGSKICNLSQLHSASRSLDHSRQNRVEYIFCRQGMTSELFEPNSGFGYWYYQDYEVMDISEWEKKCRTILKKNLDYYLQHKLSSNPVFNPQIYGAKIDHIPNGPSNFFWWMDKKCAANPFATDDGNLCRRNNL